MLDALLPSVSEIRGVDPNKRLRAGETSVQNLPFEAHARILAALQRYRLDRYPIRVQVTQPGAGDREPRLADSYAYRFQIDSSGVLLRADTEFAAITGCATLAALDRDGSLPHCEVIDQPTYSWRGLMVDTSRHYMPIARLEETLDLMACYRLNVLHLGLSNDQACRFTSDRFPWLTSTDHYTTHELRALIRYAAERAIRIVPELDVPAHTTSWVHAYPEWGAGALEGPSTGFGMHYACLDPTKPEVLCAVKDIFQDLTEVFPDEYVHIGGDEVMSNWWDANPAIQGWMRERGMSSVHQLQTWFICELGAYLTSIGKQVIGWDEILADDLPQAFTIQAWRGMTARDIALKAGHPTIVSSPYYLDLFFPSDFHYRYEPAMSASTVGAAEDQAQADSRLAHVSDGMHWQTTFGMFNTDVARAGGKVLGGEACMWSEIVDGDTLHTRVWSRMPAIAERFWRGAQSVDEATMYARTAASLADWAARLELAEFMAIPTSLNLPALRPLIEQLEPVKWYARLLGMDRVRARTSGQTEISLKRPYDLASKLDRLIDFLPPESLAARSVMQALDAEADIEHWCNGWRMQAEAFDDCATQEPRLAELRELSQTLATLADIHDDRAAIDMALQEPIGEYLLPIASPVLHHAVKRLGRLFQLDGEVREITKGHINDTFVIGERGVLQRLNSDIFDAQAVLRNRRRFDEALGDLVPTRLLTSAGDDFVIDAGGGIWRAANYVNARNFDVLPNELCEPAGAAFGNLLNRLRRTSVRPEPVIAGFHDLQGYLSDLDELDADPNTKEWLDFVASRRHAVFEFQMSEFQVIHGDCKVNNLLLELHNARVAEIVDLDTLMWGHPAWDFGDLVRSVLTGFTDEAQRLERIGKVATGFRSETDLTFCDIEAYVCAPEHMSFMLGVRFLTDHLRGDTYFKVRARGENLTRAIEQFELAVRLEEVKPAIREALT